MAQNPVTGAPVRLVVTDEDGTFLDLGGEDFSRERFSAVFARMRADGCRFAVATSNQSFQVKDVFGPLAPRVALAASNGAYVEAEGRRLRVSVARTAPWSACSRPTPPTRRFPSARSARTARGRSQVPTPTSWRR